MTQGGQKSDPIKGLPNVDYGGQGGLGDVVLHPQFSENKFVYLSYVEKGKKNTRCAAVARAKLVAITVICLLVQGTDKNLTPHKTWGKISVKLSV